MSRGTVRLELFDEQEEAPELEIDFEKHPNLKFNKKVDADSINDVYNYLTDRTNMRVYGDINTLAENFSTYHQIINIHTPGFETQNTTYLVRVENWRKYHYFYPVLIGIIEAQINNAAFVAPYGYEFYGEEDPYSETNSAYSSSNIDEDEDDEAYFGGFDEEEENDDDDDDNDNESCDDNENESPLYENIPVPTFNNENRPGTIKYFPHDEKTKKSALSLNKIAAATLRPLAPEPFTKLPNNLPMPTFTSKTFEQYIAYKPPTEKKIIVCLDTDTMRRTRESEPAFASQKQFTLKDGLSRPDIDHHYRDEKNRVVQTVITTFDYNK